jgi:hypothetical protein
MHVSCNLVELTSFKYFKIFKLGTGHQWLMPVILAAWEAEIRRIAV